MTSDDAGGGSTEALSISDAADAKFDLSHYMDTSFFVASVRKRKAYVSIEARTLGRKGTKAYKIVEVRARMCADAEKEIASAMTRRANE